MKRAKRKTATTQPTPQLIQCSLNSPEEQWVLIAHNIEKLRLASINRNRNGCLLLLDRIRFQVGEAK